MKDEVRTRFADCSEQVIGACIDVHRELGPGLLESVYERCLCHELSLRHLTFERQRPLAVSYRGLPLDAELRIDLIVEKQLIVEVKAVEHMLPVHEAQLLTYLKLSGVNAGLLVNFNAATIRASLRRMTLRHPNR